MIEQLRESGKAAYGFKVVGQLTADDVVALGQAIDTAVAGIAGGHLGLFVDLSAMHGATWGARWEEMRFLQRHSKVIARMAVVSDDEWEELREQTAVATAVLQAETRYFHANERSHAWKWARGEDDGMAPVRVFHSNKGLFGDYTPEYMGIGVE